MLIHRALLPAALVLSLGAAPAAPSHFWSAAAPVLAVRPGVGGAARPGRWMPVEVTLAAGDHPLTGSLAVEWNGAVARQDIDVAASSTSRVTLLARTIAAAPVIHVTFTSADGAVVTSADANVRLLPVDADTTLCIGEAAASDACTVRIDGDEAPANWRGFDLADNVLWRDAERSGRRESIDALRLWQAARWWQDSGFVDPVMPPFDMQSVATDRTAVNLAVFVAALLIVTSAATWRRAGVLTLLLVPVAAVTGGAVFVARGTQSVDMQTATFVHQFDGIARSIVLTRGDVEHPSGLPLTLAPDIDDATVEIARGPNRTETVASADGRPIYRNTAGRGVRQRFELEGSLAATWLATAFENGNLILTNRSAFALGDCEWRADDRTRIGTITRGSVARLRLPRPPAAGDAIVCTLPPTWLTWSSISPAVMRGSAFLVFHIWPGSPAIRAVTDAAR